MQMPKPLMLVLVGQVVVLVGALGFFALHRASEPPPRRVARAAQDEVHVPLPKLEEPKKVAEPSKLGGPDWAEFPDEGPTPTSTAPSAAKLAGPVEAPVTSGGLEALVTDLGEGNDRFVHGFSRQLDPIALRKQLATAESAKAVVVTCTDSRVLPELIFDQPLGSFSVVRLPGARLDDFAVRAVEEAVQRLHPSAVLVLGHQGCHHVKQSLSAAAGKKVQRKGSLEATLAGLLTSLEGEALDEAASRASVTFAARELKRLSKKLARSTEVTTLRVLYTPKTGAVRWLDAEPEPTPVAGTPSAPRAGRR